MSTDKASRSRFPVISTIERLSLFGIGDLDRHRLSDWLSDGVEPHIRQPGYGNNRPSITSAYPAIDAKR